MSMPNITDEKTLYRERTPWPGWIGLVYWGSIAGVSYALLMGYDTDLGLPVRVPLVMLILGAAAALERVVNGLTVLVQESRLFLYLGSIPVIRRVVPLSEIVELEAVEYRPIVEFGGWGVRGTARRRAWTARGHRAVLLTLTGDRLLYVGSDHPQRLEERIRTTMSARPEGD